MPITHGAVYQCISSELMVFYFGFPLDIPLSELRDRLDELALLHCEEGRSIMFANHGKEELGVYLAMIDVVKYSEQPENPTLLPFPSSSFHSYPLSINWSLY